VLCDLECSFRVPLSTELHPILIPLAGTPLLEYTLEFLERGGVEDIILVTSTLTEQVRSYLLSSRWGERGYPVRVRVVGMAAVRSVGDALREVDRLGLVKSDFVLVRGGVLTNLSLLSVVEEHRRMRDLDRDKLLMTMVNIQMNANTSLSSKRCGISFTLLMVGTYGMYDFMYWMSKMHRKRPRLSSSNVYYRNIWKCTQIRRSWFISQKRSLQVIKA